MTRISQLAVLDKTFKADSKLQQQIASNDSIYYEDTLSEVILKVNANVAVYFTRRPLVPNQEIVQELSDGTLILMCRNVHEQEILPLVRYWLPNIDIVAPDGLKQKLREQLGVTTENGENRAVRNFV